MLQKVLKPVLIAIIVLLAIFYIAGRISKGNISGYILDAVLVKTEDNKYHLFVLTDKTIRYIYQYSAPGKKVIEPRGIFKRLFLYRIDLSQNNRIIYKKIIKHNSLPPRNLFSIIKDNKIWTFPFRLYSSDSPYVKVYDMETGDVVVSKKEFLSRFSQISSEIINISIEKELFPFLSIKTDMGDRYVYDLNIEKLFDSYNKYYKFMDSLEGKTISYQLAEPSGKKGKYLYFIEGPPSSIRYSNIIEFYFSKEELIKDLYDASVRKLCPEHRFIEGWIEYYDKEIVIVVSQEKARDNSDRKITCIDNKGNILWILSQKQIFPELALRQKDPFSSTTFMKSRLRIKRYDDYILIVLQGVGIMIVELDTGKIVNKLVSSKWIFW